MTTQGLVTLISFGKVVMKIVAGCNGYNARKVANVLHEFPKLMKIGTAYEIALDMEFGCSDCLAVITETEICYKGENDIPSSFRKTFQRPRFNPRWEQGTADYVVIIDIKERK